MSEKANARKEELEKTGAYVEIVRQEPFTIAKDQLDLKVYLLVSRQGMVNQKIQVEESYCNFVVTVRRVTCEL